MEGSNITKPLFYVLDDGLCLVEKRHMVDTKNPYSKNEVFHRHSIWIVVCTVGKGTLIGEEILLQPNREEYYEYKVTVYSYMKLVNCIKTI